MSHLRSEKGIYIVLAAVVISAVLVILLVYGIDTTKLRNASSELSVRLEEICKDTAYAPMLYVDAIETFRTKLSNALGKGEGSRQISDQVKIYKARLIIPTMPSSGQNFCFYNSSALGQACSINSTFVNGAENIANCFLDEGSDCSFIGSVSQDASDWRYPASLWNNLQNAGNTVGCELYGKIVGVLGQEKFIEARTVWARPVRSSIDPAKYSATDPIGTSPGLTIAIASEMTTKVHDKRFRFFGASEPAQVVPFTYEDVPDLGNLREKYDPLYNFSPNASTGNRGFTFQSPQLTATSEAPSVLSLVNLDSSGNPTGISSAFYGGEETGLPRCAPNGWESMPVCLIDPAGPAAQTCPGNCYRLSDREEMLTACMNPAILIRNIFLETITELAARHGQLRNMTEILHIDPQNRTQDVTYPKNSAVQMVKFGDDITKRIFQVPYIFYDSGQDPSQPGRWVVPDLSPYKGGWIRPFDGEAGTPVGRHHALIASQLRFCYHLYSRMVGDPGLARFLDGLDFYDLNYESASYKTVPNLAAQYVSTNPWEQPNPFQDPTTVAPRNANISESGGLNAGELVSILGSTQNCPYLQDGLQNYNPLAAAQPFNTDLPETPYFNEFGKCYTGPKTGINDATTDLRPDLYASLFYLSATDAQDQATSLAATGGYLAWTSPGIANLSPTLDSIASGATRTATKNSQSHVLFVTHQRLDPNLPWSEGGTNNEAEIIYNFLTKEPTRNFLTRPITVVYFPTTKEDADPVAINRLKCAFAIRGTDMQSCGFSDVSGGVLNSELFVFSPYLAKYQGSGAGPGDPNFSTISDEAETFREYWLWLFGAHRQNIVRAAENIFFSRILDTKKIF